MKRKTKLRRSHDLPPPADNVETVIEGASEPAAPGRSSIEGVDEHRSGSIESVPATGAVNGVAGFIETEKPEPGALP